MNKFIIFVFTGLLYHFLYVSGNLETVSPVVVALWDTVACQSSVYPWHLLWDSYVLWCIVNHMTTVWPSNDLTPPSCWPPETPASFSVQQKQKQDHHSSSCLCSNNFFFLCVRVCHFGRLNPWRRKRIRASHCIYLPWVDTDARGQATWRRMGNWSSAEGRRGSPGAHNCFSRFELEESIKQKLRGRLRIQLLTAQIKTWLFSLERTHARTDFGCGASSAVLFFVGFLLQKTFNLIIKCGKYETCTHQGHRALVNFYPCVSSHIPIASMCSRSVKMGQSASYLPLRKFLTYIGLHIKI